MGGGKVTMAEERIKGVYFKECNTKCDAVFDLTREEAIARMAKAIYEHIYKKTIPLWEDEDNEDKERYLKRAEAALNALLEVNNER